MSELTIIAIALSSPSELDVYTKEQKVQKPTNTSIYSNIPVTMELEDEIISRIDKIAALCAFQSMITAEDLQLPSNHYENYSLILEDQVKALQKALNLLFEN